MRTLNDINHDDLSRLLFRESNDACFLCGSAAPHIVDANPAARRLTGFAMDSLEGMTVTDLFEGIDAAAANKLQHACENTVFFHSEERYRLQRSDGESLVVNLSVSRIHSDDETWVLLVARDITAHKRAEERLAEQESMFQAIFDTEPECVLLLDSDGVVLNINPSGVKLLEAESAEEVRGDCLYAIVASRHRQKLIDANQAVFQGGSRQFEFEILSLSGNRRWVDTHQVPLWTSKGDISALLAVTHDITERKRNEALRDGQARVLEQLTTGEELQNVLTTLILTVEQQVPGLMGSILILDPDGRHLRHGAAPNLPDEYNRAVDGLEIGPSVGSCGTAAYKNCRVIVEDTRTDPLWEPFRDVVAAYDLRACWSQPISASDGKVLGTFALYYRKPRKPTADEIRLIETAAHLAGIAIQRRQAEQALQASEERLRTFFEHSPDAVFVETLEGTVLDVNPAACQLHGMSRNELIGKHVFDLVPVPARNQAQLDFPKLASGDVPAIEGFSWHQDGTAIPVSIRANRIQYGGRPSLLLHVRDISERRRVENELREQQAQLAHVARLSTMGELVAGIAHELNQPLYAISNYASACSAILNSGSKSREQPLSQDQSQKLWKWTQQISSQSTRAGEIIRRMRDYARKGKPLRSTIALNDLVRESVELVVDKDAAAIPGIRFELAESDFKVLADPVQIQQTMVNLLRNAYQATKNVAAIERCVTIRTSTEGSFAKVSVSDNGTGLPVAGIESMFDAFFTTKLDGLGMGLPISRSIIESHDGRLWAESNPDAGATFHFTLPLSEKACA